MAGRYRVYAEIASREALVLVSIFGAKGLTVDLVEETRSLSLELALRSGREKGPYLRTPDGFVLGDLHSILNWVECAHPEPNLLPRTPVRRICARLLEDWVECWLPLWPRRSWATMERLGTHLRVSRTLLGGSGTRSDWLLAAWLEADVLIRPEVRGHLEKIAPRLSCFGSELLGSSGSSGSDDAIPISLLGILQELARDYHAYLVLNQAALEDREDRVRIDLGLGKRTFPVRSICEARRMEAATELKAMSPDQRQAVRRVLEPVGAWHVLMLPAVLETIDPSDPRSL